MTGLSRCPQCGTISAGAGSRDLCPACLLGLASDGGTDDESGDDRDLGGPACRVLTVLSTEAERTTYLAEEVGTLRLLTLDVVRLPQDGRDEVIRQCRERLRLLMRWSHSGAPRVVGGQLSQAGNFCVVSHYVKGQRLDRYCDEQRLDPESRARLFAVVRETVASGHLTGVCHGRLRPELVIASGSSHAPRPVVLGYSVTPGRSPAEEDDAAGLEDLARGLRIST